MAVGTLFDGTDDRIESGSNVDFASMAGYTAMYVCHPDTLAGFDTVFSMDNAATSGFTFGWSGTAPYLEHDTGVTRTGTAQLYSGWYCVIWTKPTGTGQIRSHIFNGMAWVHANVGATAANPATALSSLEVGRYDTGASDLFDGDIAFVGIWAGDTNDANCEALLDYLVAAAKASPQFHTGRSLLNGGTMADGGVGNNETARTGATTGVRHLPGWFRNWALDDPYAQADTWRTGQAASGNLSIAAPLNSAIGDVLFAFVSVDTNSTLTPSTDWVTMSDNANSTAVRHAVYARFFDGTANDTLTVTPGTANSDMAGVVVRVTHHGIGTLTPGVDVLVGTAATNTSATPNPPNLTGLNAANRYLVFASYGADDDDDQANWVPPNYSGIRQIGSAESTSSSQVGVAFRKVTGSTSEDPGVFNMSASEEWVAQTIAIPPAKPRLWRPSHARPIMPPIWSRRQR